MKTNKTDAHSPSEPKKIYFAIDETGELVCALAELLKDVEKVLKIINDISATITEL